MTYAHNTNTPSQPAVPPHSAVFLLAAINVEITVQKMYIPIHTVTILLLVMLKPKIFCLYITTCNIISTSNIAAAATVIHAFVYTKASLMPDISEDISLFSSEL